MKGDMRKIGNINTLKFENIHDFTGSVLKQITLNSDKFITIVGKFLEISEVFKNIMSYGKVNFGVIEIACPEDSGYTDEFVLSVWMYNGVFEVSCEPLKVNGEYRNPCGDTTYVVGDCNLELISVCDEADLCFVTIEPYDSNSDDIYGECLFCSEEGCIKCHNESLKTRYYNTL